MKRLALTLTLALLTLAGCGGSGGSGEPPPAAPAPPVVPDPPVVPVAVDYWPSLDRTDTFTLVRHPEDEFSWIDRLSIQRYLDSPHDGWDGWQLSVDWRCTYWDIVRHFQYRELVEWIPEGIPEGKELVISHMERSLYCFTPRDEYEESWTLTHDLAEFGPLVLIPDTTDMEPGDVYTDTKAFDVHFLEEWTISGDPTGSNEYTWTETLTATTTVRGREPVTVGGVLYPDALPVTVELAVESDDPHAGYGSRITYWLIPGRGVVRQEGFAQWDLEYRLSGETTFDRVAP